MRELTLSVSHHMEDSLLPRGTDGPRAASRARVRRPPGELASNRCPRSSRIRPANDPVTSRSDGNGWSIESAGQDPDSAIAQVAKVGPRHSQGGDTGSNPVGTTSKPPGQTTCEVWTLFRPAFVPGTTATGYERPRVRGQGGRHPDLSHKPAG